MSQTFYHGQHIGNKLNIQLAVTPNQTVTTTATDLFTSTYTDPFFYMAQSAGMVYGMSGSVSLNTGSTTANAIVTLYKSTNGGSTFSTTGLSIGSSTVPSTTIAEMQPRYTFTKAGATTQVTFAKDDMFKCQVASSTGSISGVSIQVWMIVCVAL